VLQNYLNITTFLGSISSKHPLVKIAPFRPDFLVYFDNLLSRAVLILDSLPGAKEQRLVLRDKLCDRNGFFAAVTEVETLIHLANAKFNLIIEPMYPARGPDFLAEKNTFRCFVEDRSIGPEEHEIGLDLKFEYLQKKLEGVPSRYALHFDIPDQYVVYSPELKRAVHTALRVLKDVENAGKKEAALYYFGNGDYQLLNKNLLVSGYDLNASEEELEIQSRCMQPGILCVDYQRVSEEPETGLFALGDEARWLQPQSRIRSVLSSKIDQMVKGERNIIVLDISHANVTETNVADALYGSVGFEIGLQPAIQRPAVVGQKRKNDGFFRNTTRMQAVVAVRRVARNNSLDTVWTVFPTNNAAAHMRLTIAELQQFGEIASGTKSLAADGAA
jgi:hypothetical protein